MTLSANRVSASLDFLGRPDPLERGIDRSRPRRPIHEKPQRTSTAALVPNRAHRRVSRHPLSCVGATDCASGVVSCGNASSDNVDMRLGRNNGAGFS